MPASWHGPWEAAAEAKHEWGVLASAGVENEFANGAEAASPVELMEVVAERVA